MKKILILSIAVSVIISSACTKASQVDLESGFSDPPMRTRAYVWWHWMNGNVTREGITADLEAMKRNGIGGAWIFNVADTHGCNIPAGDAADYMGSKWLEMNKFAAKEADRLGLELGMHNCAGWATMGGPWIEPKDGMQELVSTVVKVVGGKQISIKLPQPKTNLNFYRDIVVFAYPTPENEKYRVHQWPQKSGQGGSRNGRQPDLRPCPENAAIKLNTIKILTEKLSKDGIFKWKVPEGNWTILRLGHTPTGKENHPAAESGRGLEVDKLKRSGVDVHWENGIQPLLDKLGPLAGKSFNDLHIDSYEAGLNHWTDRMREEFKERRGYDPTPYLLTLTGRLVEDGPATDRFLWDFRQTISELFTDNFYGYFADLCHEHGMNFSTEPYTSCFEGMAVAAKADMPMGEFWVNGGYSHTLKLAASIAHTNGGNIAGAEAFTAKPELGKWQNYPGKIKSVGDLAWTLGINRFVLHSFVHQPFDNDIVPGMTFGQWGTHFDRNVTWFKPGKAWYEYIARSQFLLQYGDFAADVLAFAGQAAPNGAANIKGLKKAGFDFDSCGTNIFAKLTVDKGDIVLPSGKRYKLLQMPNTSFQAPDIVKKIRELVAAGATVLSPKPKHSPTLNNFPACEKEVIAIADEVWGDCDGKKKTFNRYGKGTVYSGISTIEALDRIQVQPKVKLSDKLAWIHRTAPGVDIFFISNQSDETVNTTAAFLAAGRKPELFNTEKGTITNADGWSVDGGYVNVPLKLLPEKSIFVVFRHPGKPAAAEPVKVTKHQDDKAVELTGPWDVSFQPDRGAPEKASFNKLISLAEHNEPRIKYFSGTATYKKNFNLSKDFLQENQQVWLDLGKIAVIAEVRLNGKEIGILWHKPFKIEVSNALRRGKNTLEVGVTNLWINRLIGDEQFPDDCKYNNTDVKWFTDRAVSSWPEWLVSGKKRPEQRRVTFTTWKHWDKDDKLSESGLMGPVTLTPVRLVTSPSK